MSFDKTFCSSPWFHMRINNSGSYEYCRWKTKSHVTRINHNNSIQNQQPLDYFQNTMSEVRQELLDGNQVAGCNECLIMEKHHKVSGRQRQLLKAGVQEIYFEKTLASSPLRTAFEYSEKTSGHTQRTVSDWQIDLGNYCNSACVFCSPESSSRLAAEFKKIGLITALPKASWCDDPILLNKFIDDLVQSTNLQYLHFIGGETLITPGFEKILQALIDAKLASNITIGFTTNLTVWSDSIANLLLKFRQVNLGMSIESLTTINDYVRWPGKLDNTKQLLDKWVTLGHTQQWLLQLRITPTCLSIHSIDSVYEYAWKNRIAVESCNFLEEPQFLRIGVLPTEYRITAYNNLNNWIQLHPQVDTTQIINTRDPNVVQAQILQDANSYLDYLKHVPDESNLAGNLITYLKKLENNRHNSILTYLPQYESFFRSAGY